jgi:uncharacterized protein Yka (UPF0111/DUF47 family)
MSTPLDPATEYGNNYDFGFTAVDADELSPTSTPTVSSNTELASQVSSSVQNTISSLEAKISELTNKVTVPTTTDLSAVSKKSDIIRLEEKMDKVLSMQLQELTSALSASDKNVRAVIDEVEERKEELGLEYTNRMKELEKLVLPLFYNLMKNPSKEYIKWPNRADTLNQQVSKILAITRQPLQF